VVGRGQAVVVSEGDWQLHSETSVTDKGAVSYHPALLVLGQ
jgi:hypothetical protein